MCIRDSYERVLAAQPRLAVNTFHGWFLQLVDAAPLSANLAGATLVDSDSRLFDELWQSFAATLQNVPESELMQGFVRLLGEAGLDSTRRLIRRALERRSEWLAFGEDNEDIAAKVIAALREQLGVSEPGQALACLLYTSWRWAQAETKVSRDLPLDNGGSVELYGRIDRIDQIGRGEASVSLLDYKTQTAKASRDRLKDDVQLPAYALLHGDAAKAAYVALDDERIVAVVAGDEENPLMADAEAQGERLSAVFSALHAGAQLPAHGVESVCQWCEMRGLCRRDYV